jgi:hypothetical protein
LAKVDDEPRDNEGDEHQDVEDWVAFQTGQRALVPAPFRGCLFHRSRARIKALGIEFRSRFWKANNEITEKDRKYYS